jgi:hypothetical protein
MDWRRTLSLGEDSEMRWEIANLSISNEISFWGKPEGSKPKVEEIC